MGGRSAVLGEAPRYHEPRQGRGIRHEREINITGKGRERRSLRSTRGVYKGSKKGNGHIGGIRCDMRDDQKMLLTVPKYIPN